MSNCDCGCEHCCQVFCSVCKADIEDVGDSCNFDGEEDTYYVNLDDGNETAEYYLDSDKALCEDCMDKMNALVVQAVAKAVKTFGLKE